MIDLFRQALGQQMLPQDQGMGMRPMPQQLAQIMPQIGQIPIQQMTPPQFDPYGQQQTGLAQAIMKGLGK